MSDNSGKWLPYNLDGTLHDCRSSSAPTSPHTFATVATATKEIEKPDDRPMNEEEIEIETNDPTIKALIKRINELEMEIHEQEVRIDRLESKEK